MKGSWVLFTISRILLYQSLLYQVSGVLSFIILQNLPIKLGYQEFGCPFCTQISKRRDVMRKHILTHTGEKPYACNLCSYRSSQKSNLNGHIQRNHTNLS